MPQTNVGIVPGGAPGAQATAWTRRTFVPMVFSLARNATPLLSALIGKARPATGGISAITVPVYGSAFVNSEFSDSSGKFGPPADLNPGENAEFTLKIMITPIPMLGTEALWQWDAAIIPILAPRMVDAGNSAAELLSDRLWNNTLDNNQINGLPLIASATGTYGGLARATRTWWQANVIHAGTVDPTRARISTYITSHTKHARGQMPTYGVTGPGTWNKLSTEYIGVEAFRMTPQTGGFDQKTEGPRSGFNALMVGGVPIFMDPQYGTEGTLYLVTGRYMCFYIHQAASWAFTGFQSTLANYQLGYVGALVTVLELVDVNPQAVTIVDQLNSDTV